MFFKQFHDMFKFGRDSIPVNYYSNNKNWGDQVNVYLLEKITGKNVRKIQLKFFKHMLAVGSVLSTSSSKSVVWGSGFISDEAVLKSTGVDIKAVRGHLTRNKLKRDYDITAPNVFGDPVVLLPEYYSPKIDKCIKLGVVAHYKDKNNPIVLELL